MKLLTYNIHLKLFAAAAAVIFWVFIVSLNENIYELKNKINLSVFNMSSDLAITSSMPKISLVIKSPPEESSAIKISDFDAYIDLKGLKEGTHEINVKVSSKNSKINILKITPETVKLTLEPQAEKEIPVSLDIKGNPDENYELGDPSLSQEKIKIKGGKNVLEEAVEAVASIKLKGTESTDIRQNAALKIINSISEEIKNLSLEKNTIEVYIPIIQIHNSKTVGVRAKLTNSLPKENLWIKNISLTPSSVVIKGDSRDLKNISFIETEPLNLSEIRKTMQKRVSLALPSRVSTNKNFKTILLKIEIEKLQIPNNDKTNE